MADLISKVKAKATRKPVEPTKSKDDKPVWYPDDALQPHVIRLIEAGHIFKQLDPVLKEIQTVVYNKLIDIYAEKMWSSKNQPENPRIVVKKDGSDARDMACMFIVSFRADGLKKFLPNAEDLGDKEPRDVLIETLMSKLVGLSKDNAEKITDPENGEFQIVDRLNLVASLDAMYYGDNPVHKSAATKLLTYLSADAEGKKKKRFEGEFLTEEEQSVLVKEQLLFLKEGFLKRACSYCETQEQLRDLIKFVKIKFFCQNYEFAIGDDPAQRNTRLGEAVKHLFLEGEED